MRIFNILAIIIFSTISIGAIYYMIVRRDIIINILILLTAVIGMITFVYLTEFWFIRNSTIKEVLFEDDNVVFVYRSNKSIVVPLSSISRVDFKRGVHYYYTSLNKKFCIEHEMGVFSSVVFDDEINEILLNKIYSKNNN